MAIWAELKKVVNSDFSKPLNVSINELLSKSMVKSVQRGVITIADTNTSASATISTVDVNKSVVLFSGFSASTTTTSVNGLTRTFPRLELTNSTTVTATNLGDGSGAVVPYQVIEYA